MSGDVAIRGGRARRLGPLRCDWFELYAIERASDEVWKCGDRWVRQMRFAGANRFLVRFSYRGKRRIAEPCCLRSAESSGTLTCWVGSVSRQDQVLHLIQGVNRTRL